MNTYTLSFLYDGTAVSNWTGADANAALLTCRRFGYLWLASKKTNIVTVRDIAGVKFNADSFQNVCEFMTPKRLPQSIDVPDVGIVLTAANVTAAQLTSQDDQASDRLQNLDRPIVTRGSLIVAITLGGVDISNELTTQLRVPIGEDANGTQYLNIGTAAADAQDGVYNTPFAAALAFATLGTGKMTNVPLVVTTSR
jgi:hypothetical protein